MPLCSGDWELLYLPNSSLLNGRGVRRSHLFVVAHFLGFAGSLTTSAANLSRWQYLK